MFSGGFGGQGMAAGHGGVQPIVSLTPFLGGKHTIKARVVDKGDVKTWDKPNSSGKLFSCTLIDETASIRATFFNDGVDNWFNVVNNGVVLLLTGGSVKNANRKFSSVNNDYELSFDGKAHVTACNDASTSIPTQRYSFVPISVLKTKEPNSVVDILGVVARVQETSKITQKSTMTELTKRSVTIADQGAMVDVTLWNDQAEQFSLPVGTVIAMKTLRIGTFDGVSLSSARNSTFEVNPRIPDADALRKWFAATNGEGVQTLTTGRQMSEANFTNLGRKFFSAIDRENLGRGEKPDYIEVRVIPTHAKADSLFYDACPQCNKKVQPAPDGTYRCEKCDRSLTHPTSRYMCSVLVSDNVQAKWVTLFDEAATQFWGLPAKDVKAQMAINPAFIPSLIKSKLHQPMVLGLRVKEERVPGSDQFGPEDRMKLTGTRVLAAGETMMPQECRNLFDTIAQYN